MPSEGGFDFTQVTSTLYRIILGLSLISYSLGYGLPLSLLPQMARYAAPCQPVLSAHLRFLRRHEATSLLIDINTTPEVPENPNQSDDTYRMRLGSKPIRVIHSSLVSKLSWDIQLDIIIGFAGRYRPVDAYASKNDEISESCRCARSCMSQGA